jgi:hypothetical protein
LLNGNRFGQFFFDNTPQLAIAAIKAFERPHMEQQAAATGRPVVDLERERRYIYSKPTSLDRPAPQRQNQGRNGNNQNRKSN